MLLRILFVVLVIVGFQLYFIVSLLRLKATSRTQWWLTVVQGALFIAVMYLLGPWDMAGYVLRYLLPLGFAIAAIVSYRKNRPNFSQQTPLGWRGWLSNTVPIVIFAAMLAYVYPGYFYPKDQAVNLSFPFRDGAFYVGHGGNHPMVNYHNVNSTQRFAIDMSKLNSFSTRASGPYPSDLSQYAIFGEPVYSPCVGQVVAAVDGLPDMTPPEMDRDNPPGNHVTLACHESLIILAHFQEGSVAVSAGESVDVGQLLGNIGNSGNSSEPHLHIHAVSAESGDVMSGAGIPIEFDGRFLIKNAVVRR